MTVDEVRAFFADYPGIEVVEVETPQFLDGEVSRHLTSEYAWPGDERAFAGLRGKLFCKSTSNFDMYEKGDRLVPVMRFCFVPE